jgi:hypothetical protein
MEVEGSSRRFIVDTGSTVSIIQPGVSGRDVTTTNLAPFGVTGKELEIMGEQEVNFRINNVKYQQKFLICGLSTEADGILGTDFILAYDVQLNFGKREIHMKTEPNLGHFGFSFWKE